MSITSADAVIMLAITGLYPTPQQLQGFGVNDIYKMQPVNPAHIEMGADNQMTAGWVPVVKIQTFTFRADADSNKIFDTWSATQDAQRTIFYANGTTFLNALGRKWVMTKGVLSTYTPMPDAAQTLTPRTHTITWQSVSPANM